MGSSTKHTDLSWELPGPRADVDLPLEGIAQEVPGTGTGPGESDWDDAWVSGPWNEIADWPEG